MSNLILVRHGESEWNRLGKWTGLTDIDLTEQGRAEAAQSAKVLSHIAVDLTFVSELCRAQNTLKAILAQQQEGIPVEVHSALNEKNYGIFTGKNKQQVQEERGKEIFQAIRRSWDFPIEGGETLRDVHARVLPFHKDHVMPHLTIGKTVLVVSHNNTLRAYIKELEKIDESRVGDIELGTAEIRNYTFDDEGSIVNCDITRQGSVH
jgi:2,3-bisphosphoglycerate-dependent phosphoglycerate mutase